MLSSGPAELARAEVSLGSRAAGPYADVRCWYAWLHEAMLPCCMCGLARVRMRHAVVWAGPRGPG